MIKNKVSIIGLGYVGLPLAKQILKKPQYKTVGFDINKALVKSINLTNFSASDKDKIIKNSEYIVICVPTPIKKNKKPNLKPLKSAIQTVSKYLEKKQKIIIESTINPGVCEEIALPILESTGLKGGKDFELAHCPERISPGDKNWNVSNIPRNLGATTIKGARSIKNFYTSFLNAEINIVSSLKIAESSKIIENTFRDINIAYVNELAKSFDKMGIDLTEVIKAASSKPFAFLPHFPGCGVGGHCIPVDPYYLIDRAKKEGFNHKFLSIARKVNNSMPQYTIDLLEEKITKSNLLKENLTIGLLGLSYKPNIGDTRESSSLVIENILKQKKYNYTTYDPYLDKMSKENTLNDTLKKSDIIIVATAHKEFIKKLSAKCLKRYKIKIVIDGRNCLNKNEIVKNNIFYKGIGQ